MISSGLYIPSKGKYFCKSNCNQFLPANTIQFYFDVKGSLAQIPLNYILLHYDMSKVARMGAQNVTVVSHKLLMDLNVYSYDCTKREFH